jgi:hypothetical protein
LEVHPDKITAHFDRTPQRSAVRARLAKGVWWLFKQRGLPPPEVLPSFGPRLACGIYLRNANVSIRNVTITPLR